MMNVDRQHRTVTPNRLPPSVQEIRNKNQPVKQIEEPIITEEDDNSQVNRVPLANSKLSNFQQTNTNPYQQRKFDGNSNSNGTEKAVYPLNLSNNQNLQHNQNKQQNQKKSQVRALLEKIQPVKKEYKLNSNQIQFITRDRSGNILVCGYDKKLIVYKDNLLEIDSTFTLEDQARCCLSYLNYTLIGLWNGKINIYDGTYRYSDSRAMFSRQVKSIPNKLIGVQGLQDINGVYNQFIICGQSEGQIEIFDINKEFTQKVISKNSECSVLDLCYVKNGDEDNLFVCRYQEGLHLFRTIENNSPLSLRHTEELLRERAFSSIIQINETELLLACSDFGDKQNAHLLIYSFTQQSVTKDITLQSSNSIIQSIQLVEMNENLAHKYVLLRSIENLYLFNTVDRKEKLIIPMQIQSFYPNHDSMKTFSSSSGDTLYILFLDIIKEMYERNKLTCIREYAYQLIP
ncbi:UNKNOWN [Stylonychia lemnae]|uniref:WD40-repeat-containing domain n=1 Tax=Stylonychia lemnae TaxID=5949 RepID=A0A078ADU7_STYLE|nr:UNKNOWN [Stylonychia lemnae]|eukprot:CDW79083.1 UNKNOWN [Stylonychia lemnae]